MIATVTAIKWKYSQKKDKSFPIKLRIGCKTQSKYYPIIQNGANLSLTEDSWNEIQTNPNVKGKLRSTRDVVRKWETEARELVDRITFNGKRPFSYGRFKQQYISKSATRLISIFDAYLKTLLNEDRIGTYRSYKCAREAFYKFLGKDIEVHDLTAELLKRFEHYLLTEKKGKKKNVIKEENNTVIRGVKKNTVAIYMRTLKVIFNVAATDNPHLMEFYPFARKRNDKSRYQIRTAAGKKGQALTLDALRKFIKVDLEKHTAEWEANMNPLKELP